LVQGRAPAENVFSAFLASQNTSALEL